MTYVDDTEDIEGLTLHGVNILPYHTRNEVPCIHADAEL